ncbi:hypothetical protein IL992_30635 [Microbispora sp. NEAU-D428]|uniref:hypothetical protein n=1 Tax=Microbispora sitophila TaxID=2771537 RepID=UPI0018684CE3|nr:hypothetical protein [Microbispora sitophila]MBE3013502.1 hypothetical protein [Microbispora sitophila]
MILATAFVLTASGGIGVTAASAATPVTPPPDTAEPVVTATVTITPTAAPAETATDAPSATPATEVPLVGPFLGALHGEVVVPTKDGCGTVTVFTQTGQAVAVADDSITVRSQDGFERSYAIGDSTRTLTGRRGGEIRQDAWISVIASAQSGMPTAGPESPAPLPSTTPTVPETTPTPTGGTPTPPETTPTPTEGTPTPPAESTPAPLPSDTSTAPAPPGETNSTPPQTEETTPAAPQGETATAAYVFDLSRPSKRLWYLGKSSAYSLKWRSGKPTWRAPEPCPTPTVVPTEPPAATPGPATTPTETAPPTDTAAPSPEPTLTDTPTPTPTS